MDIAQVEQSFLDNVEARFKEKGVPFDAAAITNKIHELWSQLDIEVFFQAESPDQRLFNLVANNVPLPQLEEILHNFAQ